MIYTCVFREGNCELLLPGWVSWGSLGRTLEGELVTRERDGVKLVEEKMVAIKNAYPPYCLSN